MNQDGTRIFVMRYRQLAAICLLLVSFRGQIKAEIEDGLSYLSTSLILVDWYSTRHLIGTGHTHKINLVFCQHPTKHKVDAYFISSLFANYLIAGVIEKKYEVPYLASVVLIESYALVINYGTYSDLMNTLMPTGDPFDFPS
jgi:hypothetical protein